MHEEWLALVHAFPSLKTALPNLEAARLLMRPLALVAREHHLVLIATNWTPVSAITSGAAAFGTLILAGVTVRLASSTRNMSTKTGELADETKRLANLAESELEAVSAQAGATRDLVEISIRSERRSSQPLLVPVASRERSEGMSTWNGHDSNVLVTMDAGPMCWRDDRDQTFWAIVPIRNIGTGPAAIDAGTNAELRDLLGSVAHGSMRIPIVGPGEVDDIIFRSAQEAFGGVERLPEQVPRMKVLEMTVRYCEITGTNWTLSRFRIAKSDNAGRLEVIGVEIEYEVPSKS